jgi:hypothetical protein
MTRASCCRTSRTRIRATLDSLPRAEAQRRLAPGQLQALLLQQRLERFQGKLHGFSASKA